MCVSTVCGVSRVCVVTCVCACVDCEWVVMAAVMTNIRLVHVDEKNKISNYPVILTVTLLIYLFIYLGDGGGSTHPTGAEPPRENPNAR